MHALRSAYGYTDFQILDHIQNYGQAWVNEALGLIQEDKKSELEQKVDDRRWLAHVMPLAQTPMSKKGGASQQHLMRDLLKYLDNLLPWVREAKHDDIVKTLKERRNE